MRRGSDLGQEAGGGGAAEGRSVKGVDKEIEWCVWRVGGEVSEDGRDGFGWLGRELWRRVGVYLGGEEIEDMAEGEGWGVAVDDKDLRGIGGVAEGEVMGE